MTRPEETPSRVSRAVTALLVAGLCIAAFVYRSQLGAWFSGAEHVAPTPPHSDTASGAMGHAESEVDHYTCSMHPSVRQAGPGKCPICGMDLVPVSKQQQNDGVVMIDEARRQLIGVRTAIVREGPMARSFRAVGRIAYDESSFTDVNLKVSGWITKLFVSQTAQHVARGQVLFNLYSPDLYAAQQDFLLAERASKMGVGMSADQANGRSDPLVRAARKRLSLLGLSDVQIEKIAVGNEPLDSIPITSPAAGFVIEKSVVEGASVQAMTRLFRIAALDKVWVEADVYEADLAQVHVGQPAKVTLDYLPGRTYDAKVAYVYPYFDTAARTGRVRVELANEDLELRPGMYASVLLEAGVGDRLQVPSSAVVYTGPRRLVFVDLGSGRFKPQEVHVGSEAAGMYEVLDGLKAGDVVATSGMFLIAAEARISTAAKYWDDDAPSAALPPTAARTVDQDGLPTHARMKLHSPMPAPKAEPATPDVTPVANPEPTATYACPMHPEVHSEHPGKCPKCGMDLVPLPHGRTP